MVGDMSIFFRELKRSKVNKATLAYVIVVVPLLLFKVQAFDLESICTALDESQESTNCLNCHDGVLAPAVMIRFLETDFTGSTPANFCIDGSHRIGINYDTAQMTSKGKLRLSSQLDPKIRLHNGEVECTSCHTCDSEVLKSLVMSNAGSQLCFKCHSI
jgi:hypothetical protein